MVKAIFLDFYGTVVHEDGVVIKKITDIIAAAGNVQNKSEIGSYWGKEFQEMCNYAYRDKFKTQRILEEKSLEKTTESFHANVDVKDLSSMMVEHWRNPKIFNDAKLFFEKCSVPIYIVSNIDTQDIECAIKYHGLIPKGIFTSEDAKSYKPRPELFEMAIKETNLRPDEIIHIGDSMSSDVKGAAGIGIKALWLNRDGRAVPDEIKSISNMLEILEYMGVDNFNKVV